MLSVFLGIITLSNGFAQQDPQYTQYMYNHAKINPAYAGSVDNLGIYGQYRTQWVGLEGAPKSVNASITSPIAQSGLGLGVHFQNDKVGAMNSNTFAIDLSYTINLSWNYKLAFGVKGSGNILDVNYDKLHIFNPSDPVTQNNVNNKFSPNIGAGVFLYSENAYVGFSIPALVSNTIYDANHIKTLKERAHYYLTGGYVFDFNQTWKLKPATLLKAVEGAPLQVDVSLNTMFKDKFTLGVAYRWDAAVSFLAGFQVDNTIFIGYSYDTDTTKLAHYNNGSHEIFMRFDLFNSTKRTRSARFF
ncbi:PorP/SprF family type IX secretion system membrane protein [Myroides sp. LJL116]